MRRDGSITIEVRKQDQKGITIVDVAGVVDTGTTLLLDEHLSALLREEKYKLVINLAEVPYVSSAGWGLFISLLQKTREHEGDIKLMAMSQEVRNVFNMLAFSNLISAFLTEEEAIAAFAQV
ncbi:STAS domain-containing protein [bacterium]|nr:STAS domain-containing protein [bacterium]